MRLRRGVLAMASIGITLSLASAARAEVTPPAIAERVEARLPPDYRSDEPVAVELEITIDETGRVTGAVVVQGPGDPVDSAVREAVLASRFTPATNDGVPAAVRVRYQYVVAPSPEPVAPPAEPPRAVPEPAAPSGPPAAPQKTPAQASGEPDPVATEALVYGATAEVEAPPREPTRRTLDRATLTRVPGTQGDALRALELLPGVGRSALGQDPVLRGAAGFESKVFFDGAPVPYLYHIGGLKSFVSSRLLDRIDLYPSNFTARYGRVVGGVIDVRSRDLRSDGIHGLLDLSLLDSSAMVEAPLSDDVSVAMAARRSNIDFFFESVVPDDAFSVVAAPVYWDYQGIGQVRVGDGQLRLMAYGSRDSLALLFDEPNEEDPTLRGNLAAGIEFHRVQANLKTPLGERVSHDLMFLVGTQSASFALGPTSDRHFDTLDLHGRSEWQFRPFHSMDVRVGLDVDAIHLEGRYVGEPPPQSEGTPPGQRFGTERLIRVVDRFWLAAPAAYAETSLRPIESVLLIPGVRVDYFDQLGDWTVDPRLGARWGLGPSTTLKAGVGLFTQPPQYWEALAELGNPDLEPYRALHTTLGVEQAIGDTVELEVEGFYKRLFDRVVATEGGVPPRFENDGVGRIYGAELGAMVRPAPATFATASYTLSRSERRDRNGPWRLFDYDQTHVLSVAANQDLGKGWELGARFRYVTGNPTTPVVGAQYDANRDLYRPIYGEVNSDRSSAFHQLDVRVEKTWTISELSLSAYLEVMNAYNAANQEGIQYGFDYSRSEPVTGVPIFPNLGVRGEL